MQKVLIANRGAIARRIVRACTEMGKQSVVVYSDADAEAPYLEEASEAHLLPGDAARDTYLNQQLVLQIASDSGADGVHPGYGFLAENAEFAQGVLDQGLTFIGPRPEWIVRMGDKVAAREMMAAKGFPVFTGSPRINDPASGAEFAAEIGYPVMVKPTGGGGGLGMQVVPDEASLTDAINRARAIAKNAFKDSGVYLERWIERPRHVEFQILADGKGGAVHMYERECSVQRRHQKLIEESPAPGMGRHQAEELADGAARVCGQLGYDSLGTLETLLTSEGTVGFLEMNTRIQVEHGVTEAVTGCDLVQLQIQLAEGAELPSQPALQGYAMEVRLYAEDPQTLLPSTGRLEVFRPPQLRGVRVETGYREGQKITPYYDALLAKLIAHGDTREKAVGRLLVALRAFEIQGVKTNAQLLMRILQDEDFLLGRIDTGMVGRMLNTGIG